MQDCLVPFSIQIVFVTVDGLHHHVRLRQGAKVTRCQRDKVSTRQELNKELDEIWVQTRSMNSVQLVSLHS